MIAYWSLPPAQELSPVVRKRILVLRQGGVQSEVRGDRVAVWDYDLHVLVSLSLATGTIVRKGVPGVDNNDGRPHEDIVSIALDGAGITTIARPQEIVRVATNGSVMRTKVPGFVQAVGPDGTAVVVRGNVVGLWRRGQFLPLQKTPAGGGGGTFRFSPSGALLLRLSELPGVSTSVEIIDTATAKVLRRSRISDYDVRVAAWVGESAFVLAGEVGWVSRFDARTLRSLLRVTTTCSLNDGGSVSPDGATFFGMGAFPLPSGGVAGVGIFDLVRGRYLGVVTSPRLQSFVVGVSASRYLLFDEVGIGSVELSGSSLRR